MTMRDPKDPDARDLAALISRLPRDVAPPPDLWQGVAARLERVADDSAARASLQELTRALPRDIAPPGELWARIEARVLAQRRLAWPSVWIAIAAAVAIAAVALLVQLATREGVAEPPAARAWLALELPGVPEEFSAAMQRELEAVQEQRRSIEAALAVNPNDLNLHGLWQHAYEAELGLIDTYGRAAVAYQRG